METFNYTWTDFERDAAIISELLDPIGYDSLVGIAAGGLPLLVKIKNLKKKDYGIIQARSYEDKTQTNLVIQSLPAIDVSRRRVVVLEDLADRGNTLTSVRERLFKLGAASVLTITLFYKPHSIFKPDIYLHEVSNDVWIQFPWE